MLSLDEGSCIGCGICVDLLPRYFEVAGGRVRLRASALKASALKDGHESDVAALEACAGDCPSLSIRV